MLIKNRFRFRFPDRHALAGRAMNAGMWSMAELAMSNALRLASNLIMTRLLLPEAFGLMTMVTTVHLALILLTDIGIHQSVTRSTRGAEHSFLRVTWVIQILRSGVITGLVLLASALLAFLAPHFAAEGTVYSDPELPMLIAVSSVVVLMSGIQSTNVFLAMRQMQLKRIAILNVSSQISAICAMLLLAQIEASVWILLWGFIVGTCVKTVLSHLIFEGPKMGFEWDPEIVDEVWHFGKWIILSSGFGFVAANADRFILAALLDKETFGFYVIAILWIQAFTMVIGVVAGQIGFPAFSEVLRERPGDIAQVLRRFTQVTDGLCIIGFVGLFAGGGVLIKLLYPENYSLAAAFMPLLAFSILRNRFTVLGQLLLGKGDSKGVMLENLFSAIAISLAIPLAFHWFGFNAALLAVSVSPMVGAIPLMKRSAPTLGPLLRGHVFWFLTICVLAMAAYLVVTEV